MAKKETTRIDKVMKAMKGASWDEGKDIGVAILARYVGFKAYVGDELDLTELLKEIVNAADKWVHDDGGSFIVAMAKIAREHAKE